MKIINDLEKRVRQLKEDKEHSMNMIDIYLQQITKSTERINEINDEITTVEKAITILNDNIIITK